SGLGCGRRSFRVLRCMGGYLIWWVTERVWGKRPTHAKPCTCRRCLGNSGRHLEGPVVLQPAISREKPRTSDAERKEARDIEQVGLIARLAKMRARRVVGHE